MIYPVALCLVFVLLGCELANRDSSSKDSSSSMIVSSSSMIPEPSFAYELQEDTLIDSLNASKSVRTIINLGYQTSHEDSSQFFLDSVVRKDTLTSSILDTIPKHRGIALVNQFGTELRVEAYVGQGALWFQDGKIKGNRVIRLNSSAQVLKSDSVLFVAYPATLDTNSQILWVLGLEKAGEYVYLNSWNDQLLPLFGQAFVVNAEAEISKTPFANSNR